MNSTLPPMPRELAIETLAYFGGGALALVVAGLVVMQPTLLPLLFWAWLLLIDGPHVLATWLRLATDAESRHADTLRRARWAFAPPLVAWALAQAWPASRAMDLLLGAGTLLSWYHLSRQHHGLLCILQARGGGGGRGSRELFASERLTLQTWLWAAFAWSAVATSANRQQWDVSAGDAPWWDLAAMICGLVVGAIVLRMLWLGWQRHRLGLSMRPWWFAVGPVGGVSTIALIALGGVEPVHAAASGPEQMFMAVTLVTGLVHGTQYLAIVLLANARRERDGRAAGPFEARPLRALAAMCLASFVVYGLLNASRGTLPGIGLFSAGSAAAQFAFALYWGVFFHHYYVDSRIWRVRQDAALRRDFGLA